MLILIAEDDFTSRNMLKVILKKCGHEVVEAIDGREAWEMLQKVDAPRLAILDWMMPLMDGLEVVRRVRALPTPQPPYIIMLTAKDEKAYDMSGLDAGINDYLAKPFDPVELRAKVEVGCRMVELHAELVAAQQALAHQATHDPLTSLPNRRAILEQATKELARANRQGSALSIGICDIDNFKQINDLYGHQTGDEVLCGFARIMGNSIRIGDYLGRIGGEEFLLILPGKVGMAVEMSTAFNRLCKRIAASKVLTKSGELSITVTIGFASAAAGLTIDEMLAAADTALHQANNEGGNRVACAELKPSQEPTSFES